MRVANWGNSLAVRIPAAVAKEAALAEGAELDVSVSRGRLIVSPVAPRPSLEDLVNGITAENRHAETDWGAPAGKEIW